MDVSYNPSAKVLTEVLLRHMRDGGFGEYCLRLTARYGEHLSNFMEREGFQDYSERIGEIFLEEFCQSHHGTTHQRVKLFIARINSLYNKAGFISRRKLIVPVMLPTELEKLVAYGKQRCETRGNCPTTIQMNEKCYRAFLKLLADDGICDSRDITDVAISKACLRWTNTRALPTIRAFLRFLAGEKYLTQDYSFLVPYVRPPQPLPSVYSVEEIQQIETEVRNDALMGYTSVGKRNYAMLLLATRIGLRPCDIAQMTFSALDFQGGTIRLKQEKTDVSLELPMLAVIRDAMLDYIEHERGNSENQYIFLSMQPPYAHISSALVSCTVRNAILSAGIERKNRGVCARVLRSSLASSMVNDGVPYEVVRRTLGHLDKDAIRHYAKLNVEQLRLYTLKPPTTTGQFADILSGRCSVK